jgi:catechol 2,3-dioxygenase-like lactoylglutathione lyase family enzyme
VNTPQIQGVGQIAITVRDVRAAKKFSTDVLGLPELSDAGTNLAFVAAGAVRLMLTTPQGAGEPVRNSIVYFTTTALAEFFRTVVSRGAVAERAPQMAAKLPDHELWIGFVRDPERNLVGLMEEGR